MSSEAKKVAVTVKRRRSSDSGETRRKHLAGRSRIAERRRSNGITIRCRIIADVS